MTNLSTEFPLVLPPTGSEIKSLYEGEDNTNALTDTEKATIGHILVTEYIDLDLTVSNIVTPALLANESYTGLTQSITAGEELTIGEVAYLKSDGKYWLADASLEATADTKLVMATTTIAVDATGVVLLSSPISFIRVDTPAEWTVTGAGDVMHLSTVGGELTNDVSGFTTGNIVRVCGYMETPTVLNFDVSKVFVELADE